MKKLSIIVIAAAFLALTIAPVVYAQHQLAQKDCTTWGCIKCMYNPRCGKGGG